ncbi:hypothetical protein [Marilutibacter maris]|uniref:Lipoprotein n=1 Tax=Marilutibacter maris TaxID=1605891 RepID=A0A2U9T3M8_9GAMM|nr:hypothetical protein [Lysobacter maris]AWV05975.1 hypothetical protein C9I47_0249 [Lysobacter maris]
MARTLIFRVFAPALAIALLGGCISDYAYRGDGGGYYYGRPSVEYRYYGGYGTPYGYSPYGYYPYSYYYRPYYPGYPYYPHRPPHHRPPHRHDDDGGKPPWRDLDRIDRERRARNGSRPPVAVPQWDRGPTTAPPMSRPLPPRRGTPPQAVPRRASPPATSQPPRVQPRTTAPPRVQPRTSAPPVSRPSAPRARAVGNRPRVSEREL